MQAGGLVQTGLDASVTCSSPLSSPPGSRCNYCALDYNLQGFVGGSERRTTNDTWSNQFF